MLYGRGDGRAEEKSSIQKIKIWVVKFKNFHQNLPLPMARITEITINPENLNIFHIDDFPDEYGGQIEPRLGPLTGKNLLLQEDLSVFSSKLVF